MKQIKTVQDYLDMPYKQKRALIEKVVEASCRDQQELLDRYEALNPKPMNLRDIIALPFLALHMLFLAIAVTVGGKWTAELIVAKTPKR